MSLITQPLALDLSTLSARASLAPLARIAVKFAVVVVAWARWAPVWGSVVAGRWSFTLPEARDRWSGTASRGIA